MRKLKDIIFHIKVWNLWRTHNDRSKLYKFLVLINVIESPTFHFDKLYLEIISKTMEEYFITGMDIKEPKGIQPNVNYDKSHMFDLAGEDDTDEQMLVQQNPFAGGDIE